LVGDTRGADEVSGRLVATYLAFAGVLFAGLFAALATPQIFVERSTKRDAE
jgi:hypothetical protein